MELEKSINRTIEYAKSFDSEISEKEIYERLISNTVFSKEEIKRKIKKNNLVFYENKYKDKKIRKVKKLGQFLNNFNNILFLGISGSVAAGHPKKNDDIDLIVITKKNKLWISRLILRWIVFWEKIPHRKYGQKAQKDEFCFNLWLDEDGLELPLKKQNLQSAVDLIMIIPIFDKKNIYGKLLRNNQWARKYVATGYSFKIKDSGFKTRLTDGQVYDSRIRQNYFDNFLNRLIFWPQFWYMKKKITTEVINYHQAIFFK